MKPTRETIFLPISQLEKYKDETKFACIAVVFSPETENNHFTGCPPYIHMTEIYAFYNDYYFEIPNIIAYYAKTHLEYTMQGLKNREKEGERILARKIKNLLEIE